MSPGDAAPGGAAWIPQEDIESRNRIPGPWGTCWGLVQGCPGRWRVGISAAGLPWSRACLRHQPSGLREGLLKGMGSFLSSGAPLLLAPAGSRHMCPAGWPCADPGSSRIAHSAPWQQQPVKNGSEGGTASQAAGGARGQQDRSLLLPRPGVHPLSKACPLAHSPRGPSLCPHTQRPPVSQAFPIHIHSLSWHLPPRPCGLHTPAGLLVSDLCTPEWRGPRGTGPPERGDWGASLSRGRFLSPSPTYRVDPDPLSTPHQLESLVAGRGSSFFRAKRYPALSHRALGGASALWWPPRHPQERAGPLALLLLLPCAGRNFL